MRCLALTRYAYLCTPAITDALDSRCCRPLALFLQNLQRKIAEKWIVSRESSPMSVLHIRWRFLLLCTPQNILRQSTRDLSQNPATKTHPKPIELMPSFPKEKKKNSQGPWLHQATSSKINKSFNHIPEGDSLDNSSSSGAERSCFSFEVKRYQVSSCSTG